MVRWMRELRDAMAVESQLLVAVRRDNVLRPTRISTSNRRCEAVSKDGGRETPAAQVVNLRGRRPGGAREDEDGVTYPYIGTLRGSARVEEGLRMNAGATVHTANGGVGMLTCYFDVNVGSGVQFHRSSYHLSASHRVACSALFTALFLALSLSRSLRGVNGPNQLKVS